MTDSNYDVSAVSQWISNMANELTQLLQPTPWDQVGMVGIHTGGVRVAEALIEKLPIKLPIATLDISFYRDDYSHIGLNPQVKTSNIPFAIENRSLILVDDVVYSGRTVRAALNTLFDYGRPARVILVALVEREGHALPIRADVKGLAIKLKQNQRIRLNQSDLGLQIIEIAT